MKIEDIEKADYKIYEPSKLDGDCVTCLYQKRFTDEVGIKYFITINKWDYSRYKIDEPIRYESHIQYYYTKDRKALDVTFHWDWELAEVEEFAEKIWNDNNFEYYERW